MASCASCLLCLWLVSCAACASVQHQCPEPQSVLKLPGHATVLGLFDAHSGENCSDPAVSGLQQMAAAAWIVNALNQIPFVPGVKLGLALYDGCSAVMAAQKMLLATVVDMGCDSTYTLGLVTTPSIMASLQTLPVDLHVPTFSTSMPSSEKLLIQTASNLLATLRWTTVGCVLAPSVELLDSFSRESVHSRLCTLQEHLLPSSEKQNWTSYLQSPFGSLSPKNIVVVIGSWQQIVATLHTAKELNVLSVQWILVPLDTMRDVSILAHISLDTLVILPGVGILQQEEETHISFEDHHKYDANVVNSEERLFISYPLFLHIALPMLQIVERFKIAFVNHCGSNGNTSISGICSEMPPFNTLPSNSASNFKSEKNEIAKLLHTSDHIVLSAVSRVSAGTILEEVAIYEGDMEGETLRLKLVGNISNISLHNDFCKLNINSNATSGRDCKYCMNFARSYITRQKHIEQRKGISAMVTWRPDAWVAAVASIAAVGITCCLAIAVFIAIRTCKGDVLEGNPIFSFLLLLSIIFTYSATLPFSLNLHDTHHHLESLLCSLRVTGTSLSYAFLFSIMFSRSLMLASCDQDGGFMSHINGYLQSVLCFFVLGVQIALSVQFWIFNSTFLNPNQCASMYEGYSFQILLCYDIFLLILLVCTSPFTIRSKRNYREGIFFTSASILSLLIWVGWTTAYLLSPRKWQDAAISGGLTATATGILVTVFIPRTYLMLTAIVRDNLASVLPSLACTNSTSVLDLNYRATSTQVLYDCVNPVMSYPSGQVNPNFYSEQPQTSFPSTLKLTDQQRNDLQRSVSPENAYQRCDSPSSPNKVTHF